MTQDIEARSAVGAGARNSGTILSVMGAVWWLVAGSALGGLWFGVLAVAGVAIGAALVWRSRSLPNVPPHDPPTTMRKFGRINMLQAATILVIALVLGRTGNPQFIPGAVAAVVGAHFIPFGTLFGWPPYRALGVGGILIGVVGLVLGAVSGDVEVTLPVVGVAFGLLLWSTVGVLLTRAQR